MNPYDEALIFGFVGGVAAVCMVLLGLHVASNEEPLRADAPEVDDNFRIVRVCRVCHRYTGPDRRLLAGQHLAVQPTLCPICAKRSAVNAANPQFS